MHARVVDQNGQRAVFVFRLGNQRRDACRIGDVRREKIRARANKLSDTEREALMGEAMRIVYGSQGDAEGAGRANSGRERIWFSPHCLRTTLFSQLIGTEVGS